MAVHAFTGTCFSVGQVTQVFHQFLETAFTPPIPSEIAQGRDKYRNLCSISASLYSSNIPDSQCLPLCVHGIMFKCPTSPPKVFLYQSLISFEKFTRKLILLFPPPPHVLPCSHYLPRNKHMRFRLFLPLGLTGSPMTVVVWCQTWTLTLTLSKVY